MTDVDLDYAADPALVEGGDNQAIEQLYADLAGEHLEALWRINARIMPFEPKPKPRPWRWRYQRIAELAARAGELVPIERGGDRRVLGCMNPGLPGVYGATATLWAAIQYLGPGESAPGHRHSPSALRFVVEGSGAWTTVDGDRCHMRAGDLVLTPAYTWHDHANESDRPMLWFDGLDLPLVGYLDAQFFEFYPREALQPVLDRHGSARAFGTGGLLPATVPPVSDGAGATAPPAGTRLAPRSPLLHYPWEATERALEARRDDFGDPHDDLLLHFTNPRTGGPVLPTVAAAVQLLRSGTRTAPHRHVHSAVYQVFRGQGETIVDGTRFTWRHGDILALPPWAVHEHHAPAGDAVLFSITDQPVLEALGLERVVPTGAHQQVRGDFG